MNYYSENKGLFLQLAKDRSPDIRSGVARVSAVYCTNENLDILIALSSDKNSLVRTEVADSLSSYKDEAAYQKLKAMCNDSYYLVRGYAEYGVGFVSNTTARKEEAIKLIKRKLKEEYFYFNKINCYAALYYLGDDSAIESILNLYRRLKYSDKCLALNFLYEVISDDNKERIISYFKEERPSGLKSVDELVQKIIL